MPTQLRQKKETHAEKQPGKSPRTHLNQFGRDKWSERGYYSPGGDKN